MLFSKSYITEGRAVSQEQEAIVLIHCSKQGQYVEIIKYFTATIQSSIFAEYTQKHQSKDAQGMYIFPCAIDQRRGLV